MKETTICEECLTPFSPYFNPPEPLCDDCQLAEDEENEKEQQYLEELVYGDGDDLEYDR